MSSNIARTSTLPSSATTRRQGEISHSAKVGALGGAAIGGVLGAGMAVMVRGDGNSWARSISVALAATAAFAAIGGATGAASGVGQLWTSDKHSKKAGALAGGLGLAVLGGVAGLTMKPIEGAFGPQTRVGVAIVLAVGGLMSGALIGNLVAPHYDV